MSGAIPPDVTAAYGPSSEDAYRLLVAFLEGGEGPESETALGELISGHAEPLIRAILRKRIHRDERASTPALGSVEDVRGQVVLRLLRRLRDAKLRAEKPMDGFAAYVAVTTYRTYYQHLRGLRPERHRLKNRLRYLLTHAPPLALWRGDGKRWLCGLAEWRGRPAADRLPPAGPVAAPEASLERRPVEFLSALFAAAGGPLDLESLVDRAAEACGLARAWTPSASPGPFLESRAGQDAVAQADDRLFLAELWGEIRQLPVKQRQALLLNLRDGEDRGTLELLPLIGVASLREIAAALEMPATALAGLWGRLPLDDRTIGGMMGVERQQVVNLRLAARRRLARRMGRARRGRPAGRTGEEAP